MFNPQILALVQAGTCAIVVVSPDNERSISLQNLGIVGTGFLIGSRTIVTAGHVSAELHKEGVVGYRRMAAFATLSPDGVPGFDMVPTTYMATISGSKIDAFDIRSSADISLLRLDRAVDYPPLRPADEGDLVVGRPVAVCGYPSGARLLFGGTDVERVGPTFQYGFISGVSPSNFVPGSHATGFLASYLTAQTLSGAPVFSDRGKVLGIHWGGHKPFGKASEMGAIGFCVPFMYSHFMLMFGNAAEVFRDMDSK
ncbi:S1 family peptidase [Peristeroidobacter agariperforans]|uniref:S1 family peptidase n=1 Tax=Peristeroidobacter agariperforans TaxID=268404 RepID=UPI00101C1B36|nr:serine protease [Peristeroidobacter agariperforans]